METQFFVILVLLSIRSGSSDDINEWACNVGRPAEIVHPGSIQSPEDPDGMNGYPHNAHCSWLLIAPQGHVIRIEFTEFDLETAYLCMFGNVTLHDSSVAGSKDLIERFCGDTLPPVVHSARDKMLVTFKTGHSGSGTGIKAEFTFIPIQENACGSTRPAELAWNIGGFVSPGYPSYYPNKVHCSWRITPDEAIRLEFDVLSLDSPCYKANISIYDSPSVSEGSLLGVLCGGELAQPFGLTSSAMLVDFVTSSGSSSYSGFRARFKAYNITKWACGNSKPAELDWGPGFITSPMTDSSLCRWRFSAPVGKVVRLEIEYFDLPVCSNCGCAGLSFFDGENEYAPLLGEYCGHGWSTNFILSGGNKAYLLYQNYKLAPYKGFKIKYLFYDIAEHACGQGKPITLTETSSLITSPGFGTDEGYPNNADCQWQILAKETQIIHLDYLDFGLESCSACACDKLQVYNGLDLSATLAYTHCDYIIPPSMKTTVNSTFLRFTSDRDRRGKGFRIQYYVEELATGACSSNSPAIMSLDPGFVFSPKYPDYYLPDSNCQWLISAPSTKLIQMSFQHMDIEFGYYCEFDYLAAYNGLSTNSPLLKRFCGNELPGNITTSQNSMLLVFSSNGALEMTGFKATYQFVERPGSNTSWIPAAICGIIGGLGMLIVLAVCFKVPERIKKWLHRHDQPEESPPPYMLHDASPSGYIASNTEVACPPGYGFGHDQYHQIAAYPPPTYEESFMDDHLQPRVPVEPPSYEDSRPPLPPVPETEVVEVAPVDPYATNESSLAGSAALATYGMSGFRQQQQVLQESHAPGRRTNYMHNVSGSATGSQQSLVRRNGERGISNPALVSSSDDVRPHTDNQVDLKRKQRAQEVEAILGRRGSTSHHGSQKSDAHDRLSRLSRSDNNLLESLNSEKSKVRLSNSLESEDLGGAKSGLSREKASSLSSLEFIGGRSKDCSADNSEPRAALQLPSHVSDTVV